MYQNKRLNKNPNLEIIYGAEISYRQLKLVSSKRSYAKQHLDKLLNVLNTSTNAYSKLFIQRIDLHFPNSYPTISSNEASLCFTKFMRSFIEQVKHDLRDKPNKTKVRYIAVKELNKSNNYHFHVALILNGHAYSSVGLPEYENKNLYSKIVNAWARSIGEDPYRVERCIHIPENASYRLNRSDPIVFEDVFARLSYFCKTDTKEYLGGHNLFASRG